MLITRKLEFSASHICRNPELSDERNRELYGAEANPHGHGHNYLIEVTVAGSPDPVSGMVMDLKELKEILNQEVMEAHDHRFLNYETQPFDRVVPTAENIARDIWLRLEPCLTKTIPHASLTRTFRGARYEIALDNSAGRCRGARKITVDGQVLTGNVLPVYKDGVHQVSVTI